MKGKKKKKKDKWRNGMRRRRQKRKKEKREEEREKESQMNDRRWKKRESKKINAPFVLWADLLPNYLMKPDTLKVKKEKREEEKKVSTYTIKKYRCLDFFHYLSFPMAF